MMSHEIRTPLNGVLGMTQLLAETVLSQEQQKFLKIIELSGETLLTVINDILDFSKIESGQLELENRRLNLRDCIENICDLLGLKAQEKNLELLYVVSPDVPQLIMGDVTRLHQILMNLVNNAIKFTEAGEVLIKVEPKASSPDSISADEIRLQFSVKDTGIGIPEAKINRLFKPFSQVDSATSRKYGGTGLGLVICERLVKLMAGTIGVESEENQGSTFFFEIKTQAVTGKPAAYLNAGVPELMNQRVFLVSAHQTSREILLEECRYWGLLPTGFSTATDLMNQWPDGIRLGSDRPGLILIDMDLPDMDGVTLGRRIQQLESAENIPQNSLQNIPLVLFTSLAKHDEQSEAIATIFHSYLLKPVKSSQLFDVLMNVFSHTQPSTPRQKKPKAKLSQNLADELPLSILIAEDSSINQELVLTILQKMGYTADVVSNGIEAIEALKKHPYNIIFMDVQMPKMDGLTAARYIVQDWSENQRPKIIAMTASAFQEDKQNCLDAGMDDYISKPIRIEQVQEMLQKWSQGIETAVSEPDRIPEEKSAIDPSIIAELQELNPSLPQKMVKRFLEEDAPMAIAQLKQAIQENNSSAMSKAAHSLKGSSALLGAQALSQVCLNIEQKGKAHDFQDIDPLLSQLDAQYQQVQQELTKLVNL
jgi:CheY-like chemotaxis protein/HPt (histidine-containing phosphotransfer) domain-containing protein